MHNGYITIDNEKMSKSKGNFFTVRDILKDYDGEVLRFFLLSGHYRNPINFSRELIEQSKNGLARMQNAKNNLQHLIMNGSEGISDAEKLSLGELAKYREQFKTAMDDDLNTADAITAVFELIKEVNTNTIDGASKVYAKECLDLLTELTHVLGLLEAVDSDDAMSLEIMALVEERQEARKAKNFARADEIRDILKSRGLAVEDTPQGSRVVTIVPSTKE